MAVPVAVLMTTGALRALLERFPPPAVVAVPGNRLRQRLVERALPAPSERRDLGDVDRVAAVVPESVFDVLHRRLVGAEGGEQLVDERPVGSLVAGADVVDLARRARVEHELDAGAVVVDVD